MLRDLSPPRAILLGYGFLVLMGTILLALPVSHAPGFELSLIDAFFTATSATSVTGLIVVGTGSAFSLFGQIVILLLIQIGGIGLMASVTIFAVLIRKKIGVRHRMLIEMDLNHASMSGVVRLSQRVLFLAVAAEAIGAVLLFLAFAPDMPHARATYFAIFHSITAFCNAGFDLFGNSLVGYASHLGVNLTIAGLIIVGGLGFTVVEDIAANKRWRGLSFHSKVVVATSAILTVAGFLMVLAIESANPETLGAMTIGERILAAFFQSVTTRTAGYNTVPVDLLSLPTLSLFLVLMFIGASPGSTGGGIKTSTAAIFAAILRSAALQRKDVELGRYRINQASIDGAIVVVLGSVIWTSIVTFCLLITERADFMTTLFEVISAIATVGLSVGLTGDLSDFGKILIALTMFVGRVGPFVLVLSIGQRESQGWVRHPERRLIVG